MITFRETQILRCIILALEESKERLVNRVRVITLASQYGRDLNITRKEIEEMLSTTLESFINS